MLASFEQSFTYSTLVIHRLVAGRFKMLQQARKCPVAISLISTHRNLMKLTSLLRVVDKLQNAGKFAKLRQVCGVFGSLTSQTSFSRENTTSRHSKNGLFQI